VLRSDCVDILTQCGDRKRFHEGQTPERICELLSPIDDPERCIPLRTYLSELRDSDNSWPLEGGESQKLIFSNESCNVNIYCSCFTACYRRNAMCSIRMPQYCFVSMTTWSLTDFICISGGRFFFSGEAQLFYLIHYIFLSRNSSNSGWILITSMVPRG